ncbi:MAG: hypothetical protein JWR26_3101 [Pedosphaera sp.]|nr:hypothetical protein [Pedosphaera sp.]
MDKCGSGLEIAVFCAGLAGHEGFEGQDFLLESGIAGGEDLDGEEAGVAAVADGDGGHGDAGGHLHDGEEGVEALEGFGLDGHADHGQRGQAGDHAGEMRGAACAGDDDAQAALVGGAGVLGHIQGRAVGGDYADFVGDAELDASVRGGFQCGPIGIAAHDDTDEWFGGFSSFQDLSPKRIRLAARWAVARASSIVWPRAVTWPILRPGALTALPYICG